MTSLFLMADSSLAVVSVWMSRSLVLLHAQKNVATRSNDIETVMFRICLNFECIVFMDLNLLLYPFYLLKKENSFFAEAFLAV